MPTEPMVADYDRMTYELKNLVKQIRNTNILSELGGLFYSICRVYSKYTGEAEDCLDARILCSYIQDLVINEYEDWEARLENFLEVDLDAKYKAEVMMA